MYWNHRVIKKQGSEDDKALGYESYYEIHEVYCNSQGKIDGWTKYAVVPLGNTLDELKKELQRMLKACDTPVLVEDGDKLKREDGE